MNPKVERLQNILAEGWWIPCISTITLIVMGFIHYWDGIIFEPDYKVHNGAELACSNFEEGEVLRRSLIFRDTVFGPRYDIMNPLILANGTKVCFGKYKDAESD